jgi:hypothetical protein
MSSGSRTKTIGRSIDLRRSLIILDGYSVESG